jgi:hypothetical protein
MYNTLAQYLRESLNASSTISDLEKLSNKVFETIIPDKSTKVC